MKIDDQPIRTASDLLLAVALIELGTVIKIQIIRKGNVQELSGMIGEPVEVYIR